VVLHVLVPCFLFPLLLFLFVFQFWRPLSSCLQALTVFPHCPGHSGSPKDVLHFCHSALVSSILGSWNVHFHTHITHWFLNVYWIH
jgi:hypothetical protein